MRRVFPAVDRLESGLLSMLDLGDTYVALSKFISRSPNA